MEMFGIHNKKNGWAALIAACLVVAAALPFTGCSNGSDSSGGTFTPVYTKVAYGTNGAELDMYLKTAQAAAEGIRYIEVTGLTAADVKGTGTWPYAASPLGKILQNHSPKKVSLKLPETIEGLTNMSCCFYKCANLAGVLKIPAGVTDMTGCFDSCINLTKAPEIPAGVTNMYHCFYGCTGLTQAPVIPNSVTDMSQCFSGCTGLTQAPEIPAGVTNMFHCFSGCTGLTQAPEIPAGVTEMSECFSGCTSLTSVTLKCNYVADKFDSVFEDCTALTAGSIKVPQAQLATYQGKAYKMGTKADRFVGF